MRYDTICMNGHTWLVRNYSSFLRLLSKFLKTLTHIFHPLRVLAIPMSFPSLLTNCVPCVDTFGPSNIGLGSDTHLVKFIKDSTFDVSILCEAYHDINKRILSNYGRKMCLVKLLIFHSITFIVILMP